MHLAIFRRCNQWDCLAFLIEFPTQPNREKFRRNREQLRRNREFSFGISEPLHASLPYLKAEVVWAARNEMARTVEDILASRTRALFLNARAALAMAPAVADLGVSRDSASR